MMTYMKRILFLLSLVFCLQTAVAQVMSDQQIVDFILSEQKKGTSERSIAMKLMQRGISADRLTKIKEEYNAENSLLGAEELTKSSSANKVNRMREEDKRLRSQGESFRSGRDLRNATSDEKLDVYEEEVSALMPESEEEPEAKEKTVFGHSIFNNELLTFEPALNIPTPATYLLGAGDQVIIDVWGASQTLIEDEISPDGYVVVEGIGPVYLAGKTVEAANSHLKSLFRNIYAESKVSLSVGKLRSIQVQVVGEVVAPGNYTLSSLSTAFNALYAAGGIGDLGTLRDIKIYRGGKEVASIDVYDFIFKGTTKGNVRLEDNDVISVGAYDALVEIEGEVKRPMMYEMKGAESLSSLINYSGGFSSKAYTGKMRVTRKSGREYSLFTVGKNEMSGFALNDGDHVYIDSVVPRFTNMVEIMGAVFYPGQYQLGDDVKTVYELIEAAGGLREDAFLNRAVMHHRNYDNTIEAQSIDIKGIVEGRVADVVLRNNDAVYIPSKSDMDGKKTLTIRGEVRFSGVYKFAENTTVEDLILQAGGLTRNASTAKIDVYRHIYDPAAVEEKDEITEKFSFELKDGFVVDGGENFVLKPYDEVYVHRSPVSREIESVTVKGAVNFAGHYAMLSRNYKLSDLMKAVGGVSNSAYVKGAYLYRRMTEEEMNVREIQRNKAQIELYEEMLKSEKDINIAVLDSIYKAKFDDGNYYSLAINLEKAIEEPGGYYDVVLRDGDILTVPEYNSTVKISGEVMHPSSVSWQEGKSLSYYIKHAGGFGNKAKRRGVYVINMNGSVEKLSSTSSKAIQPGCEIVVPRKGERRLSVGDVTTIGTATMSITTLVIALINLLK